MNGSGPEFSSGVRTVFWGPKNPKREKSNPNGTERKLLTGLDTLLCKGGGESWKAGTLPHIEIPPEESFMRGRSNSTTLQLEAGTSKKTGEEFDRRKRH